MLEFRSLASALSACAREEEPNTTHERAPPDASDFFARDDIELAISEARFFRAHVLEAVDVALSTLLADIASEVVARELQIAPVDLSAIVTAAVQRYEFETPLRARAHPQDVLALACTGLPVVADDGLRRGDVLLELRDGAIDLSLGVRLERLLSARSP